MSGTEQKQNIEILSTPIFGLTLFADGTLNTLSRIPESDAAMVLYGIAASIVQQNTNPTDLPSPNDNENKEKETTADYRSDYWQCVKCGNLNANAIGNRCASCQWLRNFTPDPPYTNPRPSGDNKVYAVVSTHEASTGIPAGIFSTVEFANEYINGRDNPEEWGITPYVVDWRRPN